MRIKMVILIATLASLSFLTSCANHLQLGVDAYNRGEYDKAAQHWNDLAKSGDPYAQYNVGLLWEGGLGSTRKNSAEAGQWYLQSAQQGFAPAMVRLTNIQMAAGYEEPALSWYVMAARWGNNDAISALTNFGRSIPAPDLLLQQRYEDALTEAQAAEAAGVLGQALGCAIAGGTCGTTQSVAPQTSYDISPTVAVGEECFSDFSCGIGFTCVKEPLKSRGVCMQSVDEYGIRQYDIPSIDSVGPNMDLNGQCQFNTDCPTGFRCDRAYKACVKR